MNFSLIPKAFDVLRKGEAVADAAKHRDRATLGVSFGLALIAIVNVIGALGYGQYVAFLTPEMATQIGLLVAGAAASWGHWATSPDRGILPAKPAVAGPAGDAVASRDEQPAAPVGSVAADAPAANPVRGIGGPAQADNDVMHSGA